MKVPPQAGSPNRLPLARGPLVLPLWLALSHLSCITVTTVNIGTKTTLEKQLIGAFEPLSEEEMLVASVRSGSTQTSAVGAEAAVAARQRQLFNRDDIRALKKQGCLGEATHAVLMARACSRAEPVSPLLLLRGRLIDEENADRQAIVHWALSADPSLTAADGAQVLAVYGRILSEQAEPGDWLQQGDGTWQQR